MWWYERFTSNSDDGIVCDKMQPCQYRFCGMCMYSFDFDHRPCKEFPVGTCETNETLMQKEKET